jgi:hypothetical protein
MEKTYSLTNKQIWDVKLWPILITVCGIFIIWMSDGSVFSIVFAVLASGISWWFNRNVPISITFRTDGYIQFKSLSKILEISVQDIHTIFEDSYHREIKVLHNRGAIAIKMGMPNIYDFIETVQKHNPSIKLKVKNTGHK